MDEDCKTLVAQIKEQDKVLRIKRRWLMDLNLNQRETKRMKQLIPQNDKCIPESLIREDDVYYENIKARIEKGFLASCFQERKYDNQNEVEKKDDEGEDEDYARLFNSRKGLKEIFSLLDEMNNRGLCCFADILGGGSIMFEKTSKQMKKFIKGSLSAALENQKYNKRKDANFQLSQLLSDPNHFHENHVCPSTPLKSYRAAAKTVLSKLQDLPIQTLISMYRKVRGVSGYIPKLHPPRNGWARGALSQQVREQCIKLLSELGEADEPQEPLANALAVAALTLKLEATPCPMIEFRKFSPETKALQNEIMKAIQFLDVRDKVSFRELKDLWLLLDPNANTSHKIRRLIRNLLVEYLFECADMETIPGSLLEALSIINKRAKIPSQSFSKEELEKEVECVLAVSAQTKQIIWDSLSECSHAFDQEFANAYIEDLLESDNCSESDDDHQGLSLPKNSRSRSGEPNDQLESIGENNPVDPVFPFPASKEGGSSLPSPCRNLNMKTEDIQFAEIDSSVVSPIFFNLSSVSESKTIGKTIHMKREAFAASSMEDLKSSNLDSKNWTGKQKSSSLPFSPDGKSNRDERGAEASISSAKTLKSTFADFLSGEKDFTDDKQYMVRNEYLALQDACDKTSMIAYHFVGRMLNELAQAEGLELGRNDVSYLRGEESQASTWRPTSSKDYHDSPFFRVLGDLSKDELMPSFPNSSREKLMDLMGIKCLPKKKKIKKKKRGVK